MYLPRQHQPVSDLLCVVRTLLTFDTPHKFANVALESSKAMNKWLELTIQNKLFGSENFSEVLDKKLISRYIPEKKIKSQKKLKFQSNWNFNLF